MAIKQLTLKQVSELLDGSVESHFGQHMKAVVDDIMDRPLDKSKRTIDMRLTLTPDAHSDTDVHVDVEIEHRVPSHRTPMVHGRTRKGGFLVVSEHSPDDIDQRTFADEMEKKG